MKKKRKANFPPFGKQTHPQMTSVLVNWPGSEEYATALKGRGGRPGGDARGKRKSEAADEWRKPAVEFAKKIWQESPDLLIATVGQRIRKLLPKDKQPPSDRALKDHIRPFQPQK